MTEGYFAALPLAELGDALLEKKDEYYRYLEESGRRALIINSFNAYNKPGLQIGQLQRSGDQDEFVEINTNHYRSLLSNRLILTTGQRPAFEPKAINTDADSQRQVALASGLLEYYERVKKMERFTTRATEFAILYSEGFVGCFWNPTKGDPYAADKNAGNVKPSGDLEFAAYNTFDVIRCIEKRDANNHNWLMVRDYKNRYDLAAKYPELAERILAFHEPVAQDKYDTYFRDSELIRRKDDTDDIVVYTFFHRVTEAMPFGRMFQFSDTDIVYADGPLNYKDIPLNRS